MAHPTLIVSFLLMLAVSFFMSGMEAGVFALNPLRIRQWVRAGRPRARMLLAYLEKPEDFLWTILIGNTLANFVVVGLFMLFLHERLGARPVWAGAVLVGGVFLFYAACDLLPKTLFRMYPNRLCLSLVLPFRGLHTLLRPVVAPLNGLSQVLMRWTGGRTYAGRLFGNRDELRLLIQESTQNLSSEERGLISRVLDLQNRSVGQITVPMTTAVTVTTTTAMTEVLRLCRQHGLSRLPVWEEGPQGRRVAGIVSLRSVVYQPGFDASRLAGEYLKPALYLDAGMRLEEALRRLQRSGQRLAIVLDRGQREVGIVGLEDILKTVFGDVTL
jgi:putative hemolysin